ncbi:TOG array regulator of axonemal microtubules protein 1 [Aplochiton taeniatus]
MMIFGMISLELHEKLLDLKNYQNRTTGIEELKSILSDLDLNPVPSDSIAEFIKFLQRLLEDSNFKVLHGTLQVLNLLIQKLDYNVDKYLKLITLVAFESLGGTHTLTRNESMKVFRQLMRILGPKKVLGLVVSQLKNKNSRVREDVLNIITAALLAHPPREFNIPSLCFDVAPYLTDNKRRVRLAALELFALFDYCLDPGKKQPLIKAVDRVELNGDGEGLMAAVNARRARHILPRLSPDGTVEYGLVVPKSGQRCSPQLRSGADLDWVVYGGRLGSARSNRTEPESDTLYGYGSLGSLTEDQPLQRRIVSAGKSKGKLPWERASLPSTENLLPCSPPNGKTDDEVTSRDTLSLSRRLSPEVYLPSFGSPSSRRRKESPARLKRSGSLDLDQDIFKLTSFSDVEGGGLKGRVLSETTSVERTFSLPSNPSTPGSFLLPSYPLASLPPASVSRRPANALLSMSNTWPNKRDPSPQQREDSPWREASAGLSSSRCSPRPLRASLVTSSSSTSSFRRALSSSRSPLAVSPVVPPSDRSLSSHSQPRASPSSSPQDKPPSHPPSSPPNRPRSNPLSGFQNAPRDNAPGSPQTRPRSNPLSSPRTSDRSNPEQNRMADSNLHLDLAGLGMRANLEEEPLDKEEMLSSLRSLRCSAAKKRAKVSVSGSDPDSPDSAVRLDLGPDSPSQPSPSVTSPASESGRSSLYSPPNSTLNSNRPSPGRRSADMPSVVPAPAVKVRASVSMDFSSLQGDRAPEVSVIGQRLTYPNGPPGSEEREPTGVHSPPLNRPTAREPIRALRPAKGSSSCSALQWPSSEAADGMLGRGVLGSAVFASSHGDAGLFDQGDGVGLPRLRSDPSVNIYESGSSPDPVNNSPDPLDRTRNRVLRSTGEDGPSNGMVQRSSNLLTAFYSQPGSAGSEGESPTSPTTNPASPTTPVSPPGSSARISSPSGFTGRTEPTNAREHTNPTQSPVHQPSPPTEPPNPRSLPRLRRAPSLNRTRLSISHSSDELSQSASSQRDQGESPELRPFSKPDLALTQSFKLLNSQDWEKKIEGLTYLRSLAQFHADTVHTRLHDVCLALIQEVKNLRSGVSRIALCTLSDLYIHLQKAMDHELEATARVLLHKAGESNAFIRQDVDQALTSMVTHCTPNRCLNALLAGGLSHLNPAVRRSTAQHLDTLVEKLGTARLLSGGKDLTERILPAATRLAQDSNQETRYFGRKMLLLLSSHADFDKMLEKHIPTKDLAAVRDAVFTLKTKGLGEMPQDSLSARGRRSLPGSGTPRASSLSREPLQQSTRESCSGQLAGRPKGHTISDKADYIQQMTALLGSKDFKERIRGMDQLVADCTHNPNLVVCSLFPVFDAFRARLQESNSKVNLYALESLQQIAVSLKDHMAQLVNMLLPAVVDNHLNSKNVAIYNAATAAISALVANLDTSLLLQPLCTKAQFLSGKAKVDLINRVAELVPELYSRKPLMVEQKVLPLLWHLLGVTCHSGSVHGRGGSVRDATSRLGQALHTQMGPGLSEAGASQPPSVCKALNELLHTLSPDV